MQGRALLNAIGNLELTGEYAEALNKLGHNLENVASKVRFTCNNLNRDLFHFHSEILFDYKRL